MYYIFIIKINIFCACSFKLKVSNSAITLPRGLCALISDKTYPKPSPFPVDKADGLEAIKLIRFL